MYVGLGQKFVAFGSVAHRILLICREDGWVSQAPLVEEIGCDPRSVSVNLKRLVDNGFLYPNGRFVVRAGARSAQRYTLHPRPEGTRDQSNRGSVRRSRDYRARKKLQVSSVFAWRGEVRL